MFRTAPEAGLNGRDDRLSARPGDRRLLGDQRHDLHARPGAPTMTAGASSASTAGAGTTCCPISCATRTITAARAPLHGAGGEWRVERPRISWHDPRRGARGGGRDRHPEDLRLQPAATTKARTISRSTSAAACAGARRKAFLKPVLKRPNLRLVTGAHVAAHAVRGRARRPASNTQDGRAARSRARRRDRSWRPARSARRICWSSRASAGRTRSRGIGAPVRARAARASARICRTICNCARSFASPARARSTSISSRCSKRALDGRSNMPSTGAGR